MRARSGGPPKPPPLPEKLGSPERPDEPDEPDERRTVTDASWILSPEESPFVIWVCEPYVWPTVTSVFTVLPPTIFSTYVLPLLLDSAIAGTASTLVNCLVVIDAVTDVPAYNFL